MKKRKTKQFLSFALTFILISSMSIPALAKDMANSNESSSASKNDSIAQTNAIIAEIEENTVDVNSVAASQILYVNTYDELVEAIANTSAILIMINNNITLENTLEIERNILFIANNAERSVTLTIGDGVRHMSISSGEIMLSFDGIVLDGLSTGGGIDSTADELVLRDVIIQNCRASRGGGINADGSLILYNGEICNNTAINSGFYWGGGGVCINTGDLFVFGTDILQNTSENGNGGGIAAGSGTVTITDGNISENVALNQYSFGGGIFTRTKLTMNSGTINNNTAGHGGGIASYYSVNVAEIEINGGEINNNTSTIRGGGISNSGRLNISNAIISNNTAPYGGGIFAEKGSDTTITDSTISENSVTGRGGGISTDSGILRITNSDIKNNSAFYGGGIETSFYSEVHIESSIISNNTANKGAGIEATTAFINDSIITNNTALNEGGGIYISNLDQAFITNCILSENTASNGGAIYVLGKLIMDGGSINNNTATENGGGIVAKNIAKQYKETSLNSVSIMNNTAQNGGGIHVGEDCVFNITNSEVFENHAQNGGGLYIMNNITTEEVNINNNTADACGGGLYIDSNINSAEISNIIIEKNNAEYGGGIYNCTDLEINNTQISENEAPYGGGIYTTADSKTSFISGSINDNVAYNGGGVYSLGRFIMDGYAEIYDNTAAMSGGGIYGTKIALNIGDIYSNTARDGAGIYVTVSFTMHDGYIDSNQASRYGGGIYGTRESVIVIFDGVIHYNNARTDGDNIYSLGTVV